MSDYTLLWFPEAASELRTLSVRQIANVLNNVALLQANPYPPQSTVTSENDGLYALRVDRVIIHYDVLAGSIVRILMIATERN